MDQHVRRGPPRERNLPHPQRPPRSPSPDRRGKAPHLPPSPPSPHPSNSSVEEEEDSWSDLEPRERIKVGSKGVDDGVPIGEVMSDPSLMRVVMGSFSKFQQS